MESNAIRVVDVPLDSTPERAEELLNAPGDSYYLVAVLPHAAFQRAYLRRYKQAPPSKAELAKEHVDDATAMSILRANRDESVRTIVELLAKAGVKRGKQWVCDQLEATCSEDGNEEKALAYVKFYSVATEDIPGCLKRTFKIKRSASWARRKREELQTISPERTEELRSLLPELKRDVDAWLRRQQ